MSSAATAPPRQVVVAGGGPTGMMLAAELALAGADVLVVERRATADVDGSRAGGLLPRTLEVLDQRGIVDRFLDAGFTAPAHGFAGIRFDISDLPTRHNHVLALWQREIEPLLAAWAAELGVPVLRGCDVVGFTQDGDGVSVQISDGTSVQARYLVGCDGGRSAVRKAAGIAFPGLDAEISWLTAEVEMTDEPVIGMRGRGGLGPVDRLGGGGPYRVVVTEKEVGRPGGPELDDVRRALVQEYGTDFGLRSASWISRFTDATRQAQSYRAGRVLLAGDAAHVHPPQGGQGLNTGVQDAVNLGWKLAQVVHGISPEALLDTYHAERHPVAARVLHNTRAQVALGTPGETHQALRDTMADLLTMTGPRHRIAAMLCALDVDYGRDGGDDADRADGGDGGAHPLVGRRMPDLDVRTAAGEVRVYGLLREARPVLLDLTAAGGTRPAGWPDRLRVVRGAYDGPWVLPVVGEVPAPQAVLIRPDGHVAWTGDPAAEDLTAAINEWFGAGAA